MKRALLVVYCAALGISMASCSACDCGGYHEQTTYNKDGSSVTVSVGGDNPGVDYDPGEEFSSLTAWEILIVCLWAHAWYAFIKRPKLTPSGFFYSHDDPRDCSLSLRTK